MTLAAAAAVCERSARGLAPTLRQLVRPSNAGCVLFWRDAASDHRALTAPIRLDTLTRGPRGQA